MTTQITEDEYVYATENYMGFCTECCDFTMHEVEPDAEECHCEGCENDTVVGAEQALIMGLIELVPEGEEIDE
jgi:hypothetical protein